MLERNCINNLVQQYLKGEITFDKAIDEAILVCLSALQQTDSKMALLRIPGEITVASFQAAFRAVSEKTTQSPSGINLESTCKR